MNLVEIFGAIDEPMLENWLRTRRQEDLHLDFKNLDPGRVELNRDDRKNFAIAMSGFANADGGIIVWGVDARPDADGIDAVSALRPISNAEAVLSTLQSLTSDATNPTVDGVRHRAILNADGSGYLVSLAPESDRGPHMAKLGENRYYKRNGSSFRMMEHFDVADMFGRRARPELRVELSPLATPLLEFDPAGSIVATARVIVRISNTGRGLARFPFLTIIPSAPYVLSDLELDDGRAGLPQRLNQLVYTYSRTYCGGVNDVIHADSFVDVTCVTTRIDESCTVLEDVALEYVLAAEGIPRGTGFARLPGSEVLELVRRFTHLARENQRAGRPL